MTYSSELGIEERKTPGDGMKVPDSKRYLEVAKACQSGFEPVSAAVHVIVRSHQYPSLRHLYVFEAMVPSTICPKDAKAAFGQIHSTI